MAALIVCVDLSPKAPSSAKIIGCAPLLGEIKALHIKWNKQTNKPAVAVSFSPFLSFFSFLNSAVMSCDAVMSACSCTGQHT